MKFKTSTTTILILGLLISYQNTNIYVPDDFDGKLFFKFVYLVGKTIGILARFSESLGLGQEPNNLRFLTSLYFWLPKYDRAVEINDVFIEDVRVRIYRNKIKTNNSTPDPVMIFYHGGGFFMGHIGGYDCYLFEFVKRLNMTVLAVELAPENPYPTPIEDCYKVTRYLTDNHEKFNIDLSRLVFAGDSAGGTIVAALTQRFARENRIQAKIQVLIYPLVQLAHKNLPSYIRYGPTGLTDATQVEIDKYSPWYFGIVDRLDTISTIFKRNEHFTLIEDEYERERIISHLNVSKIDTKYKPDKSYYDTMIQSSLVSIPRNLSEKSVLGENMDLSGFFKQLFKPEVSPLFAHDEDLKRLPQAYFILLEWDFLKDEGLLYANRLKELGVDVHIAFYENAFHGVAQILEVEFFQVARNMQDDLIQYLFNFL